VKRRWGRGIILIGNLLAGTLSMIGGGAGQQPLVPGKLIIDAPAAITAGDPLTVTVSSPVAENTTVTLGLSGSYGLQVFQAPIRSGIATFAIPSASTAKSGVAVLTAAMNGLEAQATITINPGAPAEPVTPLIGAKSIVANGTDWSMLVIVPTDSLGNPVAADTAVELAMIRPGVGEQRDALATDHLVAWTRITSGTTAGRTTVAATAGGASGPQAVLEEVPGPAAAIEAQAAPAQMPADGRSYVSLSTGVVRDANGNTVVDGTLVTFSATGTDGAVFTIPAMTISGVAEARLLAPEQPQTLTAVAQSAGVESAPVQIDFTSGPVAGTIPVSAEVEAGELAIHAGPIVTALGDYVADGVTVTFQVSGMGTELELTAPVLDGHAEVAAPIPSLPPGDYEIVVTVGTASGSTRIAVPAPS
jgi:hypothetical protein